MLPLLDKDPVWIDTNAGLEKTIADISNQPLLAVDTESNSLYAYRERVCLIQISTPATDYLIDTLAFTDLSQLAPFFANPAQQKIFHAAEYDLICLKRDYSFTFANIFDTMVAARILGETQVGLGALLFENFSILQEKKYQRANWGKRPLPPEMLDYARMDTHYLFALKTLIEDKLIQQDLWGLAQEDFVLVSEVSPNGTDSNGNSCWKVAGNVRLSSSQSAILFSLCAFRDQQARKLDLPLFKVFPNEQLLEISQAAPHTRLELQQVRGMSPRLLDRYADGLLKAVVVGESSPPPLRPLHNRPDTAMLERLKALHQWRKVQAKSMGVESDVVLSRDFMESIAIKNPANLSVLKKIMSRIPWRYEHFGDAILRTIHPLEEHENPL